MKNSREIKAAIGDMKTMIAQTKGKPPGEVLQTLWDTAAVSVGLLDPHVIREEAAKIQATFSDTRVQGETKFDFDYTGMEAVWCVLFTYALQGDPKPLLNAMKTTTAGIMTQRVRELEIGGESLLDFIESDVPHEDL